MSNRLRIITLSGLVIILGAILPVIGMSYLSWTEAIHAEQERLKSYADIMITRADVALAQSEEALRTMNQSQLVPCSAQHIGQMRKHTVNTSTIEDLGYFSDGVLQCSSWGKPEKIIQRAAVDYVTSDGIEITRRIMPLLVDGEPMMVFQLGQYSTLMSAKRFVDLVVDKEVQLVLADAGGKTISEREAPDHALVAQLIATPDVGLNNTSIYASVQSDHWIGIAIAPRSNLNTLWHEALWFYLPIAVLIDLILIVVIVRYSRRLLSPLAELEIAIKKREFVVYYQPVIDLPTGICVGAEALVRWIRPDGTMVPPDRFIPLAEENGLIVDITEQVLAEVVRDMRDLLVADRSLHIAINLSADDIKDGHIVPVLVRHLANTGIHTEQILLEMTERGFMDVDAARSTLRQVRDMGHSVGLDDFGTGYSSLQYLQGLPMDALKIDKSFVDTIGKVSASSSVVSLIIDMAKTLNLFIVAEGVERQEQADYLRAQGVHFVQGWFYGKAMPCHEFMAYYQERQATFGTGPQVLRKERMRAEASQTTVAVDADSTH